ncbi:dimethyl sulfoxide reductase anchor subunit family protein [Chachezhania sediminis]|uniref:dimethyl sulfoxide reductase anchor subunit family protein n=1 Tax=Chachezhania sediminis TaxID=2599291 RepID=UPI00131C00FD|nr:DmsC/YnfH family molybdoenzyme membrane anchor subunit [Chachezhania sediminis]
MHPAPSVILFTSLSGLGFGLLVFLGLGLPPVTGWVAFVFWLIGYVLACGGLIASTFHLGHPERALKAFTQWRSSWLSREAWGSVIALVLMAITGIGAVFLGARWALPGVLGALVCLGTVFITSMIYAQLKSVPRWHSAWTPLLFLAISLAGGALLAGQASVAVPLLLLAGAVQIVAWFAGDRAMGRSGTTLATATGLGPKVRLLAPPHTGPNYLTQEMVFVIGRKHATRLRAIALLLMSVLPVILLLLPFHHLLGLLAVLFHVAGVVVSRWLFFAEAEHVVGLYYGQR